MAESAPAWVDGEVIEGQLLTHAQTERLLRMVDVLRDLNNIAQICEIKRAILESDYEEAMALFGEFTEQEQQALWVAPTKGGIFTTEERKRLRKP